jgi:hypothetical protein
MDLRDHRTIWRNAPTIKRPEMDVVFDVLSNIAQPWNACVRGLRYRPRHIEMKHRFGCACPQFGQPPLTRITTAGCTVSADTVPQKIDIDILVSRPMALEIIEERWPVERQSVLLEVLQRE